MKVTLAILCIIAILVPGFASAAVAPTDLPIGSPGWQPIARSYLFQVPFYRQQRSLTCEIATLRMALKGIGITVNEGELWEGLKKDPTPRRVQNGVVTWGDPNAGFVGNPNGSMFRTGFGVYAPPIAELAKRYAESSIVHVDDPRVIDAALSKGHPIIYWTVIGNNPSVATWNTPSGKTIRAPYYEHTRVIVGYRGTAERIEGLYVIDPLTSLSYISWNEFHERNAFFDHVGVEIFPK